MDLIALAIPGFWASMGYEAWWLRRRADLNGPSPVDYELKDTIASLAMGTGSLVIPLLASRAASKFSLPSGRHAKKAVATALGLATAATVADVLGRSRAGDPAATGRPTSPAPDHAVQDHAGLDQGARTPTSPDQADLSLNDAGLNQAGLNQAGPDQADLNRTARQEADLQQTGLARFAGGTALGAIVAGGIVATSTWAARSAANRLFEKRVLPDLGSGVLGVAAGIVGWDFIYYWNHRLQHESRIMWAIHVVHHSSERYNLSTALRQPWADSLGMFVPYGLLALLGVRPQNIETGRQINLIYQYWIHTDAIRRIGPLEEVLNTPSHHRVHHGMDHKYLDRNHGSILIIWDRLFGTFQREEETPTYGLTKNIDTFNPLRIVSHEHVAIAKDVMRANSWRDRLSHIVRGPGWRPSGRPDRMRAMSAVAVSLLRR